MSNSLAILIASAASIGFLHTALGPDHYLPFIVLSRANNWSVKKTALITVLCGLGHVGSSIILGTLGIAFGFALSKLEIFESVRGSVAAWALIIFGAGYLAWGIYKAIRNKPHKHIDPTSEKGKKKLTPWILFIVFVLGPCEPLIPLLMFPAAEGSVWGVALVSTVFGVATIGTMTAIVLASSYGLKFVKFGRLERYTHAMGGAVILLSGLSIQLLGS